MHFHDRAGLGKPTRGDLTTAVWGNYDMQHLQSALGVVALLAFAWAISENRARGRLAQRRRGAGS